MLSHNAQLPKARATALVRIHRSLLYPSHRWLAFHRLSPQTLPALYLRIIWTCQHAHHHRHRHCHQLWQTRLQPLIHPHPTMTPLQSCLQTDKELATEPNDAPMQTVLDQIPLSPQPMSIRRKSNSNQHQHQLRAATTPTTTANANPTAIAQQGTGSDSSSWSASILFHRISLGSHLP